MDFERAAGGGVVQRWLNRGCDAATPEDALVMRRARGCALVAYTMQFLGGVVLAGSLGMTSVVIVSLCAIAATTFCVRWVTADHGRNARIAFHTAIAATFAAITAAALITSSANSNATAMTALYPIPLIMATNFVLGIRAAAGWTVSALLLLAIVTIQAEPVGVPMDPETWRQVTFSSRALIIVLVFAIGAVSRRFEDHQARRLEALARQDSLTGLANRSEFDQQLHLAISRARRHNWSVALLFIDLDRFKEVNDSLGHTAGDQVLESVGVEIAAITRQTDVAARIGGDEFAVILEAPNQEKSAAAYATRLLERIAGCGVHAHPQLDVSASIGIAQFPEDAQDAGELLRRADLAMYAAKREGGGRARTSS